AYARTRAEVARFFDGPALADPGPVTVRSGSGRSRPLPGTAASAWMWPGSPGLSVIAEGRGG
ncbi:hypothetical protein ACFV40_35195, partial [Streptomyces sp. NPDC059781]